MKLYFMMDEMPLEQLEQIFGLFDVKVGESELASEMRSGKYRVEATE